MEKLLPQSAEGELAAVCSWADLFAVRSHYYWSRALHFVDTPDFRCNYDYNSKLIPASYFSLFLFDLHSYTNTIVVS